MKISTSIAVGACAWVCASLFTSSVAVAGSCPSYEAARTFYFSGQTERALAALQCLKARYPNDLDVRRLLSDIYWWQGQVAPSIAEARDAETLEQFAADRDTAIHLARRASNFSLAGSYQRLFSGTQTGNEAQAQLDWRFEQRDHLIANYQRLVRVFNGSPALTDSVFGFEYSRVQGERSYVLTNVGFSTTHVFSPVLSVAIEPHYTLHDDSDVGVEARYAHYVGENVVIVSPGWRHIYGLWTFTGRMILTLAGGMLPSAEGSLAYLLTPGLQPHLSAAGGRTLEGPQLPDTFYSVSADVSYHVWPEFIAKVLGTVYRGTLRSENRLGVGGEWLF